MASDFDIHIGTRELWGGGLTPFGLNDHDAFQHVWLNGQTGVGKSALMRSMLAQTIANGHGCTLIDLNGDLATELPDTVPLSRRDDVVIINPANAADVLSINPFYQIPIDRRSVVANDFTEAAKHIWVESWGERMDWILTNVIAAILDAPPRLRPTLLSIPLVLTDEHYRNEIIKHIQDINVARFFKHEFLRYSKAKRDEYIMPIENKIGKIISNPFVRNMLSPYKPAFQLKDAINNRSILIIRLAKGALGKTPARLLASLSISTLLNAAIEQEAIPYEDRIPHYLFIDEQHNLGHSPLSSGYSEHRKYKFGIITSTQFTEQLDHELLASMFGNIGTIIAFRSGQTDAQLFEKQIGEFPAEHYTQLALGEVRVRLLRDGKIVVPFRASTSIDVLPPINKGFQIHQFNRERYTKPRYHVEETYRRWMRKYMIDPAERRQQRQTVAERKTQRPRPLAALPQQPPTPSTISQRAAVARANINAIAESARARHCDDWKPTRRKLRRPQP